MNENNGNVFDRSGLGVLTTVGPALDLAVPVEIVGSVAYIKIVNTMVLEEGLEVVGKPAI